MSGKERRQRPKELFGKTLGAIFKGQWSAKTNFFRFKNAFSTLCEKGLGLSAPYYLNRTRTVYTDTK